VSLAAILSGVSALGGGVIAIMRFTGKEMLETPKSRGPRTMQINTNPS